ncbi:MAG: hypothetical protein HYS27_22030 [Deltaproteobacteria bacterium]|nr:hypothetical protein [Deltaproteobacteria bacterium]
MLASLVLALLLPCCTWPARPDAGCAGAVCADGGAADGGLIDGGPPEDSGIGREGEGEGEPPQPTCSDCGFLGTCIPQPERLDDLVDDAGVPHYGNCAFALPFENDCTNGECATSDAQRAVIEGAHLVAAERGYRVEIADVTGAPYSIRFRGAVVVDWAKASLTVTGATVSDAGVVDLDELRSRMPRSVPPSLPSLASLTDLLRTCDPAVRPNVCHLEADTARLFGVPVGVCGTAAITLWSDYEPDAGISAVECLPSELPCCYWEDYP